MPEKTKRNIIKNRLSSFFLSLIIFLFAAFIPSAWADFDSAFPDNTVFEVHVLESGFYGGVTGAWGANDELYIINETFTFMSDGTFTGTYPNDDGLVRTIGEDGSGNNTFSATFTPESGTDSGTYTISQDGTITLTFASDEEDEDVVSGILSEDGQTVIFGISEYDSTDMFASFGVGIGVKRGTGFSTYFADNTKFVIGELESGFHVGNGGPWSDDQLSLFKEELTFMSDGTFTGVIIVDDELTRSIGQDMDGNNTFSTSYSQYTDTESGTYSISSDGTVTLNFTSDEEEDETGTGILSADGEKIIFSFSEYDNTDMYGFMGLGTGVKKGSGFAGSFPDNTVYVLGVFESGFHGGSANAWGANDELSLIKAVFTFMSNGTINLNVTDDDNLNRFIGDSPSGNNTFSTTLTQEPGSYNGTYTVSSDGIVTITFNPGDGQETLTGLLSADGENVFFGFSEYSNNDMYGSLGIGMGVKSLVQGTEPVKKGNLSGILPLLLEE